MRRGNEVPKRKRGGWCSRCRNTDQDGITVYNLKFFGYNWQSKEAVKSIRDIIHLLRQAEPIEGDPKWQEKALCAGTQSVDSFEWALGKSDTLLVYKSDDAIVGFFLLNSATCSRNLICSTQKGVGKKLVKAGEKILKAQRCTHSKLDSILTAVPYHYGRSGYRFDFEKIINKIHENMNKEGIQPYTIQKNIPGEIPPNLEEKLQLKLDNIYRYRQEIFDDDEYKDEDEAYNIDEFIAELILKANPQLRNIEDVDGLRGLTLDVRDALNYEYPMIKNLP